MIENSGLRHFKAYVDLVKKDVDPPNIMAKGTPLNKVDIDHKIELSWPLIYRGSVCDQALKNWK